MKNVLILITILAAMVVTGCEKNKPIDAVIGFEEFQLEPEGYLNNSQGDGYFLSSNLLFPNRYNSDWDSWEGFAISNHTDVTTQSYINQYSSIAGGGASGSQNYAVWFFGTQADTVRLPSDATLKSISVSNSTYAYLSMKNGDGFSKKFGGESGNDPDWYKLQLTLLSSDDNPIGSVSIFLADFRFDDNTKDYISNAWTKIGLDSFKQVASIVFKLESSDTGQFGINTPAYFCLDNIELQFPSE